MMYRETDVSRLRRNCCKRANRSPLVCMKGKDYEERRDLCLTDNTNADIDTRAHWIKLASSMDIPIRCVLFTSPAKLCEHNDTVRALGSIEVGDDAFTMIGVPYREYTMRQATKTIADQVKVNPESRTMLPKMAFTGFASRYREPSLQEGFQDITKVEFQVRELPSPTLARPTLARPTLARPTLPILHPLLP